MSWVDEPLNKGKYYFICQHCGEGFRGKTTNRRYCDEHSLKGFSGRDYTRELARKRDKYTCQICYKKWKKEERRFDVHHLQGLCGQRSTAYDPIKDLDNLITLCHKCHLNLSEVRKKMSCKSSPRLNKK